MLKLTETTNYNLLESIVRPSFKIEINKEAGYKAFIMLGKKLRSLNIMLNIEEEKDSLLIILDRGSIQGDFNKTLVQYKKEMTSLISNFAAEYNLSFSVNVQKTLDKKDIFEYRKERTFENIEDPNLEFYIYGEPEYFIKKNNSMTSLCIKIGHLFYRDDMFEDGKLGSHLMEIKNKFNLKTRNSTRVYFNASKDIKSDLLSTVSFLESIKIS